MHLGTVVHRARPRSSDPDPGRAFPSRIDDDRPDPLLLEPRGEEQSGDARADDEHIGTDGLPLSPNRRKASQHCGNTFSLMMARTEQNGLIQRGEARW